MHSALYNVVFYMNPVVCELLEGLLLWRLYHNAAILRYPYLCSFVCYDFLRTPALLLVAHFWHGTFRSFYWYTDVPAQFLHFLILWEAVRVLFPPDSSLRQVGWKALVAAEAIVVPTSIFLCYGQAWLVALPSKTVPYIFEQYSSLAQALLLMAIAGVARYYRIPFGRNARGLIFSLGPYLLIDSLSFASDEVFRTFARHLELLPAASFTAMIAVWLWAFWKFAPSPYAAVAHQPDLYWKHQWNSVWETTLGAARRRSN